MQVIWIHYLYIVTNANSQHKGWYTDCKSLEGIKENPRFLAACRLMQKHQVDSGEKKGKVSRKWEKVLPEVAQIAILLLPSGQNLGDYIPCILEKQDDREERIN